MTPDAGEIVARAGSGLILAHDRPFTMAQAENEDTSHHLVVEKRALQDLLPGNVEIGTRQFSAQSGVLSLIKGYISVVLNAAGPFQAETAELAGTHLLDLFALLLRPSRDAFEVIEGRGLKVARTQAVLDAIARHHARPDLSADIVARQLGISARQVHRLLEDTPKTFYEHVLERRLMRAHELLTGRATLAMPVADVARRAGFTGLSHFSRSFSARFGDSPSGVRAKAAREATLHHLRGMRVRSA